MVSPFAYITNYHVLGKRRRIKLIIHWPKFKQNIRFYQSFLKRKNSKTEQEPKHHTTSYKVLTISTSLHAIQSYNIYKPSSFQDNSISCLNITTPCFVSVCPCLLQWHNLLSIEFRPSFPIYLNCFFPECKKHHLQLCMLLFSSKIS